MSSSNNNTRGQPSGNKALPVRQTQTPSRPLNSTNTASAQQTPNNPQLAPSAKSRTGTASSSATSSAAPQPLSKAATAPKAKTGNPSSRPSGGVNAGSTRTSAPPSRSSTMSNPQAQTPWIPFSEVTNKQEYTMYQQVLSLVQARKAEKPRILVFTDIEQDYDDLLAVIFLAEMHRLGAVELAGFVANHHPAEQRAKFLRTTLHLLNLGHVPVAIGTAGTNDIAKHAPDFYYGLKNITFAKAPWNDVTKHPFPRGEALIDKLATADGPPHTVLLISSLQDIGEFMSKKDGPYLQKNFRRFVSQGGYNVTTEDDGQISVKPNMDMMNNQFNAAQSANYTAHLARYKLPSDAWSREAVKAARIPGSFMQQLFGLGPLGEHLRWLWMRQEFKYYWDPVNWPFLKRLDVDWYLNTRLGLDTDPNLFAKMKRSKMRFDDVVPLIKVMAYDCCAAVGTIGDDLLQSLGVLHPRSALPPYNSGAQGHPHRVFGKTPKDLGGISGAHLAAVMRTFLLGSLRATSAAAKELIKPADIKHRHQQSPYGLDLFQNRMLPLMRQIAEARAGAAQLRKAAAEDKDKTEAQRAAMLKEAESCDLAAASKEANLGGLLGVKDLKKLPTRADIPYEQLYEQAMKEIK